MGAPFRLSELGSAEIFQRSYAYPCLSVQGAPDAEAIEPILEAYDLVRTPSNHPGDVTHLRARLKLDGTHKAQTLVLLAAALELVGRSPVVRCLMTQISGLHFECERAMREPIVPEHDEEARSFAWAMNPQFRLTLDAAVSMHLRQANLPLPSRQAALQLNEEEIERLHAHLAGPDEGERA